MSLILTIANHKVASLPYLWILVLKFIHDYQNMSVEEIKLMQFSIIKWKQKIDYDIALNRLNEEELHRLQDFASRLKKNQAGGYENLNRQFKEKNISYERYYRLRHAYKPEDFVRAQQIYRDYAAKNPEQEDRGQQSTPEVKKILNIKAPSKKIILPGVK